MALEGPRGWNGGVIAAVVGAVCVGIDGTSSGKSVNGVK